MNRANTVNGAVPGSVAILSMASYTLNVLPNPYNSVVFGLGAGLLAATVARPRIKLRLARKKRSSAPVGVVGALPGVSADAHGSHRLGNVDSLDKKQLLRRYDRAFGELVSHSGAESRSETLERLKPIICELSPDLKAWSGDARLRVYMLLQEIAKDLDDTSTANASLGLLVLILLKGGKSASEMARPILGEKIRKMYGDPAYAKERFLPRLMLVLDDYDPQLVENLTKDAIHVWGEDQFSAAWEYLGLDELRARGVRGKVKDFLGAEIARAGNERDATTLNRAVELYHSVK